MTTATFQLTRLILIDSFSPERIVELPLEGGAVLTGRNGRGKTSLLQLLMLFYGESPNRIVTAEAGRDSFIGYYLPRLTSYLVYEYQRPDGAKRMVVVYADKHGELLRYRFVRHAFEVGQFVTEDNQIVPAPDFVKHLKIHGFEYAEWQVETTVDYRNIIQGIPSSSTNRQHQQQMRLLLQDYSFGLTRQPLRQVEKIVSGMFRRKTNFDDLQSMVIDCVSDDAIEHSISGDRRKIEDWPKGYRAYTGVMAHAGKMQSLLQAEDSLQVVEGELAQVKAKFASLQQNLTQHMQQVGEQVTAVEQLLDSENQVFQQQQNALTAQRTTAKAAAEFVEQKANQLQQQADDYNAKEIAQLEKRVQQQPVLQQELDTLRQRKGILLGEQQKISLSYEQLKQHEHESFNLYREQQAQRQQQLNEFYETRLQDLAQNFDAQETQQNGLDSAQREQLEHLKSLASEEQGRCKLLVEHPILRPEVTALLEQKQIALQAVRDELELQYQPRRELESQLLAATQAFAEQEQQISQLTRQLQHAESILAEKRALFAPDEGTLLFYLKNHQTDWAGNIAKVINPALLQRRDLQPNWESEPHHSMYGLMLNLERLETHSSANATVAEQAVAHAEQQVAHWQIELSSAKAKLAECGKARESAEKNCQQHERGLQKLNLQLQSAQDEANVARKQLEQHKQHALAEAKQLFEQAQAALQSAQTQLKTFEQQTRQAAEQRKQTYQQKVNELRQKRKQESEQLKHDSDVRQQLLNDKVRQLDLECQSALQQQGVDTTQLNQLEQQAKVVQTELAAISTFANLVEEWRYWLANEWVAHEQYSQEARQARATEASFEQQINQLEAAWKQRQQQLMQQRKHWQTQLTEQQNLAKSCSENLDYLNHIANLPAIDYDAAWTLDLLVAQKNQLQQNIRQLDEDIRKVLNEMVKGFRQYQGTPPEQYLQTAVLAVSPAPCRDWIKPFKRWFDSEHQEYKRVLLMEAVSIAGEVQAFHATMSKFHLRVLQFNRELQAHLDTSLAFDSISHLNVEVVSTLHELKYWSAICEMAESYTQWNSGLTSELPPPEFAYNIEQLLEHWEVKAGIRADFINLIRLQGEVTENGHRRIFKRASDLEVISSNGLSYLILATIFVAFINRIRRDSPVNIVWALDELKDLDAGNVVGLIDMLIRNNITLVSAFPDPDPDTLALFRHRFTIEPDRRLARVELMEFVEGV